MSRKPPSSAEVDQMIARVTELLKATRPQVKAKKPHWRRINELLQMARDELGEVTGIILDWELENMRAAGDALPRLSAGAPLEPAVADHTHSSAPSPHRTGLDDGPPLTEPRAVDRRKTKSPEEKAAARAKAWATRRARQTAAQARPAPASPFVPAPGARIDLASAPSSMEQLADSWRKK